MPQVPDFTQPIDAVVQQQTLAYDAGHFLPDGVTYTGSITVAISDLNGIDHTPSARLIGSPQIGTAPPPFGSSKPNTALLQKVGNCVAGANYLIVMFALTTAGDIVPMWNHLGCVTPA